MSSCAASPSTSAPSRRRSPPPTSPTRRRSARPASGTPRPDLRAALRSSRIRILTQFNALPQGVKFLVDLRTDLLRFLDKDEELAVLDRELESRLTAWFDVGFLELQRITWHSPASLLEKLIQYEAVHEIRSWNDLRNRLDSDRRLYAFFHPRMPQEPLIFVEVALTKELSGQHPGAARRARPGVRDRCAPTPPSSTRSRTPRPACAA
jgi:malonyl-CoA decarboxylase